jgi:hypothetical protein
MEEVIGYLGGQIASIELKELRRALKSPRGAPARGSSRIHLRPSGEDLWLPTWHHQVSRQSGEGRSRRDIGWRAYGERQRQSSVRSLRASRAQTERAEQCDASGNGTHRTRAAAHPPKIMNLRNDRKAMQVLCRWINTRGDAHVSPYLPSGFFIASRDGGPAPTRERPRRQGVRKRGGPAVLFLLDRKWKRQRDRAAPERAPGRLPAA